MEFLDEYLKRWRPEEMRRLSDEEYCMLKALMKNFPGHNIPLGEVRFRREEQRKHQEVKRQLNVLLDFNIDLRETEVANLAKGMGQKSSAGQSNQSDAESGDEPLSERAQDILVGMLETGAISSDMLRPIKLIVAHALGSESDSNSAKDVMADLKVRKLIMSKIGRGGGYWLTESGRSRAKKLRDLLP